MYVATDAVCITMGKVHEPHLLEMWQLEGKTSTR